MNLVELVISKTSKRTRSLHKKVIRKNKIWTRGGMAMQTALVGCRTSSPLRGLKDTIASQKSNT